MLRRLIEFSLTQRAFILILAGLTAALGGYAFRTLPIDAFPNVSPVQVKMILKAPGMTPRKSRRGSLPRWNWNYLESRVRRS